MPDNAELVEKYEDELFKLVRQMFKEGIDPETIRFLLQEERKNIKLMAYCQAWLSQYAPQSLKVAP